MCRAFWLIGVFAAAAVGAGLLLAAAGGGPAKRVPAAGTDGQVVTEAEHRTDSDRNLAEAAERENSSSETGPSGRGMYHPHAGDDVHGDDDSRPPLSTEQVWADLADPANSDLPPEVFRAAARTASAVVVADTTGEGRDRWPGHWHGTPAGRCCRTVSIHAVGARRHPRHRGDVETTIVWSGEARPGVSGTFREELTQLRLIRDDAGDWRPAR